MQIYNVEEPLNKTAIGINKSMFDYSDKELAEMITVINNVKVENNLRDFSDKEEEIEIPAN